MIFMSSSIPPQMNLGFQHSCKKFTTETRNFRVFNSKERKLLEPGIRQNTERSTISGNDQKHYHTELTKHPKYPPLISALKEAAEENVAGFHFPGHNRGRAAPSSLTQLIGQRPFVHDLPELPELGNLFAPEGPVIQAQRQAAELFGALETWFLVGGTTCGIQAAIMGTCSPGDTLILPRNCHISAIAGMVLSGVVPKYIFPEYDVDWNIAAAVSPSEVEKAIKELDLEGRAPAAVFITSPTYHGVCSDLKKIAELCHLRGIPLIVDEAHGAHFGFHPQLPFSALQQGADLAVQSTHKVLCSLTQSSMLHLLSKIVDKERISKSLHTLQSTSPSYLLLASLDAATAQLSSKSSFLFDDSINLAIEAKNIIKQIPGISVLDFPSLLDFPVIDPLRITVGVSDIGLSGYEADEFLFEYQRIIPELIGSRSITFPFSPGTCIEHVQRLVLGLNHLSSTFFPHQQVMKGADVKPFYDINMKLIPRDAFFAKKRNVEIEQCIGNICGELICTYPPGIPIMFPGEMITEGALSILQQAKADGATVSGASDPMLSSLVICDV